MRDYWKITRLSRWSYMPYDSTKHIFIEPNLMTIYLVTTEIKKPSWWIKLLRWLGINPKRNEFRLSIYEDSFEPGDILNTGWGQQLLILRKIG